MSTDHQRLLGLCVLALASIKTGYEPHWNAIDRLKSKPISRLGVAAG